MATKKSNKKLTLSNIDKLNNEFNEKKTVRVCGEYEVNIDMKFRKTKIQKLLLDYFTILQDLKKQPTVTNETIMATTSLLNSLIIKYFSDTPIPEVENIEKLIHVSNALLDLGIMEELFNHYPKDQIEMLTKEIDKAAKGIGEIYGELAIKNALDEMDVEEDGQAVQ